MKSGYDQFFKKARTAQPSTQNSAKKKQAFGSQNFKNESLQNRISNTEKSAQTLAQVQKIAKELSDQRKPNGKRARRGSIQSLYVSIFGFLACMIGLFFYKEVESTIKKFEISLFGSAIASESGTSAGSSTNEKDSKEKSSSDKSAKSAVEDKNSEKKITSDSNAKNEKHESYNQEHLTKLQERKRELDQREEELNRVESELAAQKVEIEKKLKNLEEVREQISGILKERVKSDSTKVESLVQVYSNMKAPQAAKIFETMDEDLAIEILGRMKKKNAADIMNLLKPEKAQAFSEKFAGYRVPASK